MSSHAISPSGSCALLLALIGAGCVADPAMKLPYAGFVPMPLGDGWTVSSPAAEGIDPVAIEALVRRFHDEDEFSSARSLLIARHGRLVAEAYLRDPADRERLHNLQSASKSVTSVLLGIAIDRGLLTGLDTPLYQIMPAAFDDDARKRALTLGDLLTMRAGLAFDNGADTEPLINEAADSAAFVLGKAYEYPPGERFLYNDGSPQLLSAALQARSGKRLDRFAQEQLFGPLGISEHRWETHRDGTAFGAFGVWLRPRDMLRFGEMATHWGRFQGQRIVSEAWMRASTTARVYPYQSPGPYGYYWWLRPDHGAFGALGHGGQMILAFPEQELVVVITGDAYTNEIVGRGTWDMEGLYARLRAAMQY